MNTCYCGHTIDEHMNKIASPNPCNNCKCDNFEEYDAEQELWDEAQAQRDNLIKGIMSL